MLSKSVKQRNYHLLSLWRNDVQYTLYAPFLTSYKAHFKNQYLTFLVILWAQLDDLQIGFKLYFCHNEYSCLPKTDDSLVNNDTLVESFLISIYTSFPFFILYLHVYKCGQSSISNKNVLICTIIRFLINSLQRLFLDICRHFIYQSALTTYHNLSEKKSFPYWCLILK